MKVTIELPATLDVFSRKQKATFGTDSVPEDKRSQFYATAALHGLKQAIADAAASAASATKAEGETRSAEEIALDLMESKIAGFASGEWTQRREAAPSDPIGSRAWKLSLDIIRSNDKLKAAYGAADADAKRKLRKKVFDKFEAKLRTDAKAQLEAEQKSAEALDLSDIL